MGEHSAERTLEEVSSQFLTASELNWFKKKIISFGPMAVATGFIIGIILESDSNSWNTQQAQTNPPQPPLHQFQIPNQQNQNSFPIPMDSTSSAPIVGTSPGSTVPTTRNSSTTSSKNMEESALPVTIPPSSDVPLSQESTAPPVETKETDPLLPSTNPTQSQPQLPQLPQLPQPSPELNRLPTPSTNINKPPVEQPDTPTSSSEVPQQSTTQSSDSLGKQENSLTSGRKQSETETEQ